jgi:simple sugar transport system substrate-binding protein
MQLATIVKGAAAAAVAVSLATAAQAEQLKVGFVYVSPIGDAGWTYQHDVGRKEMEKNLAGKVSTRYIEKVPEGPDSERIIRRLARSGHKLIFTTSFGYGPYTLRVAKKFPNTVFMHATGDKTAKNVGTYLARFYEGRYLTGVVAGKMTKSNNLGYVAAIPIPEVIRGINAFTMGVRSVNPKAQVRVIWTGSWFDPGKERQAAETLIAQGADILTQHVDSPATVQAAEAKGVYAIGYHSDMSKHGKKAHLTATVHNWGAYYTKIAKQVMAGKWKSGAYWGGIKDGIITLAPFGPAVPAEVKTLVMEKQAAIAAGKLHPFQGPVKDQDGKVIVAAGKVMSDHDMHGMNYYVEGIVSKLPKK